MKLLNYDSQSLILMNVKTVEKQPTPTHYSRAQVQILRNLVKRKPISKEFFDFVVLEMFGKKDWKELNYGEMYSLIYILTHFDYKTGKERA